MSREGSFTYRTWEHRQNEIAHKRRIADMTKMYLDRYETTLNDMAGEGLVQYVQTRFREAQKQLRQAQSYLRSNPQKARELSVSIGSIVGVLPREAREIRRNEQMMQRYERQRREMEEAQNRQYEWRRQAQQERQQREKERLQKEEARIQQERILQKQTDEKEREEAKKRLEEARIREQQRRERVEKENQRVEFLNSISEIMGAAINDPVEMDVVYDAYQAMKAKFRNYASDENADVKELTRLLNKETEELKKDAVEKAQLWREKVRRENLSEIVVEQVRINRDIVSSASSEATSNELQKLVISLNSLESDISSGRIDLNKSEQTLSSIQENAEQTIANEQMRKDTIHALIQTIQSKGFIITPPQLKNGVVNLTGKRPSGELCQFHIRLDGGFNYCFDNYKGNACKKDISEVKSTLEKVYGVVLSDERIIKENPDRIDREAFDRPTSGALCQNC